MSQPISDFTLDVVLLEPEIPGNTGTTARTCAAMGCRLHLIEPLGFSLDEKYVRRAGLDYWHLVDVTLYPNWETFCRRHPQGNFFFFSKKAKKAYHEVDFCMPGIYLIFGKESVGLPEYFLNHNAGTGLRIPMKPEVRSLNLSNAVAIVMYEAFRQNGFPWQ